MNRIKYLNYIDKALLIYHALLPAAGTIGFIYKYKQLNLSIFSDNTSLDNAKYLGAYIVVFIFIAVYMGFTNEFLQKPKTVTQGLTSLLYVPLILIVIILTSTANSLYDYLFYLVLIEVLGSFILVIGLTVAQWSKTTRQTCMYYFGSEFILAFIFALILKPVLINSIALFTVWDLIVLIIAIIGSAFNNFMLYKTGTSDSTRWPVILVGIFAWFIAIALGAIFF